MDVNLEFLNGNLEEEVYIEQPEGFDLLNSKDYVCNLKKYLYGLKQTPRAWYGKLDTYLQQQGFKQGTMDSNIYTKSGHNNIIILEFYVDDIVFGNDDDKFSQGFAQNMQQ